MSGGRRAGERLLTRGGGAGRAGAESLVYKPHGEFHRPASRKLSSTRAKWDAYFHRRHLSAVRPPSAEGPISIARSAGAHVRAFTWCLMRSSILLFAEGKYTMLAHML